MPLAALADRDLELAAVLHPQNQAIIAGKNSGLLEGSRHPGFLQGLILQINLPIQNQFQRLPNYLLVHFLFLLFLVLSLQPPGPVSPCGSVLITLNGDNSKSFLGIIYTIPQVHICVDYAPECTCYFHRLERICVYRKRIGVCKEDAK